MLPTFCELAGATASKCDGVSLVDTLLGRGAKATPAHPPLYWEYHSAGSSQAVRMENWKGIRTGLKKNPDAPVQLYDLGQDPAEANDVAAQKPEVVARIKEIMATRTPSAVPNWNF
jgi:arylsulfatase A-like enzyme